MADKLATPQAEERPNLADMLIGLCAGLALVLVAIYFALQIAGYPSGSRSLAGSRDFVSYWATGRQLVLHGDPYDGSAIAALEHREGLNTGAVLIMRNPPWALPFAYPLGLLSLRLAALLWSVLLLACLLVSVRLVRHLYGDPPNRLHWLALSFTPALICITMGQTSLFALLGLVLFLRWHRTRPFLAGTSLWLCALKPHLFMPFAAALAAWIVVSRAWKLLAGAAATLAITSALASFLYPMAWIDYERLMRSPAVENDFIPCLACVLRQWADPQAAWLQYLPAAGCCLWAIFYYWRRRATWDWRSNGGLLMLVSLAAAPYCWFYDQCLAIPALLDGAYASRSRKVVAVLALAIFILDIQICIVHIVSLLYFWTAPAWLAWYLFARCPSPPDRSLKPDAHQELPA